ncbi:MAG: hypothetical protein KAR73_03850 [Spirochaetales bacterium]|nr:hypothetical protein [Spirochaetales bacterium]
MTVLTRYLGMIPRMRLPGTLWPVGALHRRKHVQFVVGIVHNQYPVPAGEETG